VTDSERSGVSGRRRCPRAFCAVGEEPDGRRVDEDVARLGNAEGPVPCHEICRGRRPLPQQRHQARSALSIAVHDSDRGCAGKRGLDRDRARRPACPEHDKRLARRIDDGAERREESLPVGVLADVAPVAPHDAVNGADHRRPVGEAVEMIDHADLAVSSS